MFLQATVMTTKVSLIYHNSNQIQALTFNLFITSLDDHAQNSTSKLT